MNNYQKEMKKCIKLAQKACGNTSPNPLVGCIALDKNNKIISQDYHKSYGQYHAERLVLNNLKKGQAYTLIVNLEPCCHYGKTPPCTDIIIEKGVKKVVYGMKDPNPLVAGKGIQRLKQAGLEVIGPILEDECKKLNEIFIINKTQNRTFVALKTATTIDGKISTQNGDSKWITSDVARNEVKKFRKYYDAILTSSATILADNPKMEHKRKIILDRCLKTKPTMEIYKQGEIIVFYDEKIKSPDISKNSRIKYVPSPTISNKISIDFVLKKLYELGIMSVFVECGGILNGSFLPHTDKLYHFIAPKILSDNSGKSCFEGNLKTKISECTKLTCQSAKTYPPDLLIIYSKNQ